MSDASNGMSSPSARKRFPIGGNAMVVGLFAGLGFGLGGLWDGTDAARLLGAALGVFGAFLLVGPLPRDEELRRLKARVGELTTHIELLGERVEKLESDPPRHRGFRSDVLS